MPSGGPQSGGKFSASRPSRLPYPTMPLDEIQRLPVASLAERDAHLYLWTTNAFLEAAFAVARGWGFTPSTTLVWAKNPMGVGLGGAWAITTEFIIFARRGSLKATSRVERTWFNWIRQYDETGKSGHSAKPDAFLDLVEQVSPGPYIELFSRRARLGWDTWGDEALHGLEALSA
jgi:N6-adenosine-specific RNA methylase IME4